MIAEVRVLEYDNKVAIIRVIKLNMIYLAEI